MVLCVVQDYLLVRDSGVNCCGKKHGGSGGGGSRIRSGHFSRRQIVSHRRRRRSSTLKQGLNSLLWGILLVLFLRFVLWVGNQLTLPDPRPSVVPNHSPF